MKVWREYFVCDTDSLFQIGMNFELYFEHYYVVLTSAVSPFVPDTYRLDGSFQSFNFFPEFGTVGTSYEAVVAVYKNTPSGTKIGDFKIIVNVLEDCTNLYSNCCTANSVNVQWVNQAGGMQNYYFNGVQTIEVSQENAKRFIDPNNIARYSERGQVYDGKIISTKKIPQSHVDLLDSLRYSIQAYINVDDVLFPIIIDPESYTKYKSKDKVFDVFLKFIFADPVKIQTQ